jgi:hypothetical protein
LTSIESEYSVFYIPQAIFWVEQIFPAE